MRKITAEERIKQAVLDMEEEQQNALYIWFTAVRDVAKETRKRAMKAYKDAADLSNIDPQHFV
jgi:dsDNA-binding SOS-regulon protein